MKTAYDAHDLAELSREELEALCRQERERRLESETEVARLRDELEKTRTSIDDLTWRMNDAKANAELAQREFQRAVKRVQDLETQLHAALADLETKQAELETAIADVNQLQGANKALKREKQNLAREVNTYKEALNQSREETEKVQQEVADVQNVLTQTQQKLAESQAGFQDVLDEKKQLEQTLDEVQVKLDKAQDSLSLNYTNSGKTSAFDPNHPVIPNGRVKTGKSQGGQPEHKGKSRNRLEPDKVTILPIPPEFLDESRYRATDEYASRQSVSLKVILEVEEYRAQMFVDLETNKKVHAPFAPWMNDGVTLTPETKAALFILMNRYNVSISHAQELMEILSGGKFKPSTGALWGLNREFYEKSQDEVEEIAQYIRDSEIRQGDYTTIRFSGTRRGILICATPDGHALFTSVKKKGREGIKGSPIEKQDGVQVSDRESTFVNHCGAKHQLCIAHIQRDLKGIFDKEKCDWADNMHKFFSGAIHFWKQVNRKEYSTFEANKKASDLISKFYDLVDEAKAFYANGRPFKGYTKGENLCKDLVEKTEMFILFLRDFRVPPTNNLCEGLARKPKRKEKQSGTLRSEDGSIYYCSGQTIMETALNTGKNVFAVTTGIFAKPSPRANNRRGQNKKRMAGFQEELNRWRASQA